MNDPDDVVTRQPISRRARRRWMFAIGAAVGVHAAAFVVLGVSPGRSTPRTPPPSGGRWVGERTGENIELINPEPLFLPTRWNAATQVSVDEEGSGPGAIFRMEEPRLAFAKGVSPPGLVVKPEGVRTAGVAIRRFSRPYFSAMGEHDGTVDPLPARAAVVEIRDATTGAVLVQRSIPVAAVTDAGGDPRQWPFWEPFEMLLAVEPSGTLGLPLVPAPGSGVEAVDSFFRRSLRQLLRPDLLLPAGYYRVVVGP